MEKNSNLKVGFALKRIRQMKSIEGKKYTQAMMAKDLGVGQSYIGGLENNTRIPSFKTLTKISDALGISLRNLIDLCEYQRLTELYCHPSKDERHDLLSSEELYKIGTPEAFAFRDVSKSFDFENLNFKLGEFLDNIDVKKKIYEGENFPYIDSTNLSDVISKGIDKQKNIFFNNQKLTDGQILGLNHYLEAITNQKNGGV
ncbi:MULTISPECIES: helix-turn-helix transcriptional regulator [unclassified Enterococcus]|uniref:helix-turn-helix domain-containing protein n=1 Tax=unclassified Enterococcus TaxID=2608891 RepID=UPI001557B005|nr:MULTISPECIES: helix-turn-helix transcriptional regulator [unclassified Enterococcus]MBS7577094.1 helix-turn-helix transcriptional regulator [Enterococcus sp. MMGLQ5-2]MBS7584459.1 helix-turn-helix transcriptional regulator [Enterococcus sp. MMGLQ5-1]NPD12314.1 helix-turn-helix transcriptional regulator [Enterococcus sp. MMGLQ5-1]NPD36928.1 helix-turn-helix transcriptional regulator [Enterococcus sp. MMGLQ5-2]